MQHIYSNLSQRKAMRKVSKGLRYVWPDPEYVMAGASALSYRRYQLGARPLAALLHEICRLLALQNRSHGRPSRATARVAPTGGCPR
ncbi:MAG: hypothetical protein KGS73_07445 [Chloroflexi bacterium]|nr:hypothetical protein [Chloroflexota bacterium]